MKQESYAKQEFYVKQESCAKPESCVKHDFQRSRNNLAKARRLVVGLSHRPHLRRLL